MHRIGALNPDKSVDTEGEAFRWTEYEILFKKIGVMYEYVNLDVPMQKGDDYWEYLIYKSEKEEKKKR